MCSACHGLPTAWYVPESPRVQRIRDLIGLTLTVQVLTLGVNHLCSWGKAPEDFLGSAYGELVGGSMVH